MGGAALALSACHKASPVTASHTPKLKMKQLNSEIGEIARRIAPGVVGAGLMNLDSGQVWTLNGDHWFPMESVFKAPLAAYALSEVDAGRLSLAEQVQLKDTDLSPPDSAIAAAWPGRSAYSYGELLAAAVRDSDNTAADLLMRKVGGPGAVSAWLTGKELHEIRIDRYERELQPESLGMPPFRPAWASAAAYQRAYAAIPSDQHLAALKSFLADPRDRATPRGMLHFLELLDARELISPTSTQTLAQLMTATTQGSPWLKAGLPRGSAFAHKIGMGPTIGGLNAATNDVGVFVLPDKRRYAAAVFLSGAPLGDDKLAVVLADIARAMVRGLR
jgi:beta-lactamase class A